jgi:cytoplasmic iron level regulating protein YaaA (DUF328/UPF0246 family)
MTREFAIIGCGAAKADELQPAAEMYTSTYFRKKREYAEEKADRYWILSAKHGLLEPHEVIEPYDVTPDDLSQQEKQDLRGFVGTQLDDALDDGVVNVNVALLLGQKYRDLIRPVVEDVDRGLVARDVLGGVGGIGKQMAFLDAAVEETA